MAQRLADAGHELTVWNRSRHKAEALAGARVAGSPAEAASGAEAVVVMISDPAALVDVTEGPDGVLAGVEAGSVLVQMATVGPAATERLAAAVPAGVALVDAPVLGSRPQAEAGELIVFAGAEAEALARVEPLLAELGRVLHVGGVGAGSAAKLAVNLSLLGVTGVLGEALALAEGLGLSLETAFTVLAPTPVGPQVERRRALLESGEYPPNFALDLALKDARLVVEAAAERGVELRLAPAIRDWLADADAAGRGGEDFAAVLEHIRSAGGADR